MSTEQSAPDTITVNERHLGEVRSAGADIFVTVNERRTGNTTSGRIVELRQALKKRGIGEDDAMLESIEKSSWAWIPIPFAAGCAFAALFSQSLRTPALQAAAALTLLALLIAALRLGSLSAKLKIRCAGEKQVHAVLDTVLTASSADVQSIAWRYEIDPEAREAWAAEVVRRARRRAEKIAKELDLRIVSMRALHEDCEPPQRNEIAAPPVPVARKRRATSVAETIGPAPSNTTQVHITVSIQYCVEPVSKKVGETT